MWEFFDRLISLAIPRIRDFRGLNPRSFDGRGNYTFGVTEQLIFPEIDYDKVDAPRGMDITIVTTARTDAEGKALLDAFGFPFRKEGQQSMAKKALINKQQRKPKFKVRALHPLQALRSARSRCTASSACAGSASASWPTPASCPVSPRRAGEEAG